MISCRPILDWLRIHIIIFLLLLVNPSITFTNHYKIIAVYVLFLQPQYVKAILLTLGEGRKKEESVTSETSFTDSRNNSCHLVFTKSHMSLRVNAMSSKYSRYV